MGALAAACRSPRIAKCPVAPHTFALVVFSGPQLAICLVVVCGVGVITPQAASLIYGPDDRAWIRVRTRSGYAWTIQPNSRALSFAACQARARVS
jgi:hypothetical protein